ncbi:hypothetical protein [Actinoplanes sp. NPDC051411]|uniref:hypothetical protein n=1 Tax=Actinoplanes sp. NPDC051411 TaxID=3155522 RepID=UPI003442697A
MHVFRISPSTGPDRLAVWAGSEDPLDESGPSRRLRLPWPFDSGQATDVFGHHRRLRLDAGWVELDADATPVFLTVPEG